MKASFKLLSAVGIIAAIYAFSAVALFGETKPGMGHFVVTNDDVYGANTATFYVAKSSGKLTQYKTVKTGGSGMNGGVFAANSVALVRDSKEECVYVSDGGSGDVAGIVLQTQKVTGRFKTSNSSDKGNMTMALNPKYLYAGFLGSSNIAAFKILPGCKLRYVNEVSVFGLNSGSCTGMALQGSILVLTYGDGSIESFNIAKGVPKSNNDEQLSTGFNNDGGLPAGLDITEDGHYAIFGDAGSYVEIEVSDISSGKLTATIEYGGPTGALGPGQNSNNVRLSPDESLLYISVNVSGEVAAAFFDKTTGALNEGCFSSPLKGYGSRWDFTTGLATKAISGTGEAIYVAEDAEGMSSSIGIVEVSSSGGTCTLTEFSNSPVRDPNAGYLQSIGAYPPRPF